MFTTKTINPEAKFGDYIFKLEINDVAKSTLDLAHKELHENQENIENGMRELRHLLKEESNLRTPLDNDQWVLGFLRLCSFNTEKAFQKIKTYYDYKKRYANVFKNNVPSRLKHVFEMSNIIPLPKRDQYGRRIVLMQAGKYWNLRKVNRDEYFQAACLCHELCGMEPASKINGLVAIADLKEMTLEHIMQLSFKYSKRNVESYEEGASFRTISLHIINEPSLAHGAYQLVRPFVSKELDDMMHFHGSNMKSLHKFISPDCLPERYGGSMKLDLNYGPKFYEILQMFEDDFVKHNSMGYID
ncbi:alpha-tocopherol transfer protein-like [Haematobia irritans]|uniref:alpha-tocopherol transfer protein-like n=1 Tax=Haematobia irritans TaxID=7368 RepID=UPI003F4FB280